MNLPPHPPNSQVLETNMNEWMNESRIKVVRGNSSNFKISLSMVPPIEQSDKKIQTFSFLEKSTQQEEEEEP